MWVDDDAMIQLDVLASNDSQVAKQDFYIYPKDIIEFSEKLQKFPKDRNDEVKIEYGVDPKFYCYFMLKAVVLDDVGHSALEIKYESRSTPPSRAEGHFFMVSEVATINDLGKKLSEWVNDMSDVFRHEWKNT